MAGSGAAIAEDVDGDGYSEVLLGGREGVHLFSGASLEPGTVLLADSDWVLTAEADEYASAMYQGSSSGAAFLPDVDGDMLPEVLVGAMGVGRAYLVPGASFASAGALSIATSVAYIFVDPGSASQTLGRVVSPAGDVDGDGTGDMLVGDQGVLWWVPGSGLTTSEVDVRAAGASVRADSVSQADTFGIQPTVVGDLDGDGFDDLVVDCGECGGGAVYGYSGARFSPGAVFATADADFAVMADPNAEFAAELTGDVDLDGDGRDDWVATASALGESGGVFLFYRGLEGPSHRPDAADIHLVEENFYGGLGVALAAGDFDGDGRPDLAVQDDDFELRLYVVLNSDLPASGTTGIGVASLTYASEDPSRWSRGALRMDGDIDADGLDDLLYADPHWSPEGYDSASGAALVLLGR